METVPERRRDALASLNKESNAIGLPVMEASGCVSVLDNGSRSAVRDRCRTPSFTLATILTGTPSTLTPKLRPSSRLHNSCARVEAAMLRLSSAAKRSSNMATRSLVTIAAMQRHHAARQIVVEAALETRVAHHLQQGF